MTTQYRNRHEVPNETLADRLDELADAVVARMRGDPMPFDREFTCRIPAELDRDADLVLSEAAKRLRANAPEPDANSHAWAILACVAEMVGMMEGGTE